MDNIERAKLIAYRMARAKGTLDDVEFLIKNNSWNSALNRLYYSCFYAVVALLLNNDIDTRGDAEVKQLFELHFVLKNIVSKEAGEFYAELYRLWEDSDFKDFFQIEKEEVIALEQRGRQFVNQIEEILSKQ